MAVLSTLIGWSTQHTIMSVYDAAVAELALVGQDAPPFPVNSTPLSIMTNMIIYNVLIGSLLAIVLGYFVGIHDRMYGVVKILFSRPVRSRDIFLGKILATLLILSVVTLVAFVVSVISLGIFGVLGTSAVVSVLLFYGASLLYMSGFAFLSMSFAFVFQNSTSAMLYALFIWMIITFALPELSSALLPTSSLNPILPPTDFVNSPTLSLIHAITYPFSVSEHYKALCASLLGVGAGVTNTGSVLFNSSVVMLWSGLAFLLSLRFFTSMDPASDTIYE
jgi:ABC-type transport system involved in multi-copper enzyme maturation permease subunit